LPYAFEQGVQVARVFGDDRNVGALVGAESGMDGCVMVAKRAWMNLHCTARCRVRIEEAILVVDERLSFWDLGFQGL
jgi:hypothetical protein